MNEQQSIARQLAMRDPFDPRPLRLPKLPASAFMAPLIVIDIPAEFKAWSGKGLTSRAAATKYELMTWQDMVAMGALVRRIAERRGCVVLPWIFPPTRRQQEALFDAWGLLYKTKAFCWAKLDKESAMSFKMGMGHHTRSNSEDVDLWVWGRPERYDKSVRQLLTTLEAMAPQVPTLVGKVGEHSEKPPIFYEACETVWKGPRVELFSRKTRPGWLTLGYDIDGWDIRAALSALADGVYPIPSDVKDPPLRLSRIKKLRAMEAAADAAQRSLLW
jgi:N6-adenosine-specific RNA methylase IME4